MQISMIVAMSSNRVIGIENKLPWKLSADMAWFKKQTINKIILLGRKTWESLPIKPLPGRKHIIISQNENYQPRTMTGEIIDDIIIASSVDKAIESAQQHINQVDNNQQNVQLGEKELMVIGGASIYELMLPYSTRLYLTTVKQQIEGDAWFPEINESQWQKVYSEDHPADEKNQYDYNFAIKEKVKS